MAGAVRNWTGLRHSEELLASLTRRRLGREEETAHLAKFDIGEWKLHLQRDHLPYRRDCRVCVERASGRPHRKISHPSAYSLAVDTAGPFRCLGEGGYKYLMVGCYRFPKLAGIGEKKELVEVPGEAKERVPDDGEDWILDGEPVAPELEAPEGEEAAVLPEEEGKADEDLARDKEVEALKDLAKPLEFSSVYLARPMKSRKKTDALRAVQELYVQLRSQGLPLCKLHMDRARELQTDALEAWAAARDIEVTRTQGSDPQPVRFLEVTWFSPMRETCGTPPTYANSRTPPRRRTPMRRMGMNLSHQRGGSGENLQSWTWLEVLV